MKLHLFLLKSYCKFSHIYKHCFVFLPVAAKAVWPSPTIGFTMIMFTLVLGDKYEMIKWKVDATFELNICLTISRISGRSYCWHSYRRSSWCAVICSLYISWILPKEEGGGTVTLSAIWGSICSEWAWYIYSVQNPLWIFVSEWVLHGSTGPKKYL